MSFKDSYPDYAAIEGHIRKARVERSLAIAQIIADVIGDSIGGLKKLARTLGAKRAGALPAWARHLPQPKALASEN
jgi:hypothetical protein